MCKKLSERSVNFWSRRVVVVVAAAVITEILINYVTAAIFCLQTKVQNKPQ